MASLPPSSVAPPAPSLVLRVDVQNLPRAALAAGRSGQLTLRVPADLALHELKTALHDLLVGVLFGDAPPQPTALDFDVEVYEPRTDAFHPLTRASQLGRRSRLNVVLTTASDQNDDGNDSNKDAVLALPARMFAVDTRTGGFRINGHSVFVDEVENSGLGTGLTTWDGSVVLAKYLEHKYTPLGGLHGMRIVEVGAGTGLVGLSAALIGGARRVTLTDLAYTMANLQHNIQRTMAHAPPTETIVEAQVLDWLHPRSDFGDVDLILASDVVWVEELIAPLVDAMHAIATASRTKTTVLMSHQQRSVVSDAVLFRELEKRGFERREVSGNDLHPAFVSDRIHVWEIIMR